MAKKIVAFTVDDGNKEDARIIEILARYGFKASFNLCSGRVGKCGTFRQHDTDILSDHFDESEIKEVYKDQEIASHTIDHKDLYWVKEDAEVIRQVEQDRLYWQNLTGKSVVGLAYPNCAPGFDQRVKDIVRQNTGILYAKTGTYTKKFDMPTDLYEWNPTAHACSADVLDTVKAFQDCQSDKDMLFVLFTHGYNLQIDGYKYGFDFHDMFSYFERTVEALAKTGAINMTMGEIAKQLSK